MLKEMAYSGDLQQYNIRGVCWRVRGGGGGGGGGVRGGGV